MESTNVLGSRLINTLQAIDKLRARCVKRPISDDFQQLKYSVGKLYGIVATHEHTKRSVTFVQAGLINVLLRVMVEEGKEKDSQKTLITIHHILSKIARKDRKFSMKARLQGALPVTLNLLKSNINDAQTLLSILSVVKLYSSNSTNSAYLGKQGLVVYLFRAVDIFGKRSTKPIKLILDILYHLTKLKNNVSRVIGLGGIQLLLPMYHEWQQADVRNKQVELRKAILLVLKNLTLLEQGRNLFVDNNGIRILYESAQESADCREVESLITLASLIMRKCCPQDVLPVVSPDSPVMYKLPSSEFYKVHGVSPAYEAYVSGCSRNLDKFPKIDSMQFANEQTDQESFSQEDSVDEQNKADMSDDEPVDVSSDISDIRTAADLKMYEQFFPELSDIDILQSSSASSEYPAETSAQIIDEKISSKGRMCNTQSDSSNCDSYVLKQPRSHVNLTVLPPKVFQFPAVSNTVLKSSELFCSSLSPGPSVPTKNKITLTLNTGSILRISQCCQSKRNRSSKSSRVSSRKSRQSCTDTLTSDFTDTVTVSSLRRSNDSNDSLDSISQDSCISVTSTLKDSDSYKLNSSFTKSVQVFSKLAYPDYKGVLCNHLIEPLYHRKLGVQRGKIFEDIQRMIDPNRVMNLVRYDLDKIISKSNVRDSQASSSLGNTDAESVSNPNTDVISLEFNAQFESGNLRKAVQVRRTEYDLVICPDVNTDYHHQWFYFEVSAMLANVRYRFNIVNCEKLNSQFNFGMQPVMFSVIDSLQGHPYWKRVGQDICYYKNHFSRVVSSSTETTNRGYYTATFTLTFPHTRDICYIAYHYPYTYTSLMTDIKFWESQINRSKIYLEHQSLCLTVAGNVVPVLTITASPQGADDSQSAFRSRPYVFLTARVHPGESNSSWIMAGVLEYLLSEVPVAQMAREKYIFKVIPMLNPDGVINGNHRCSLSGDDLNRRWHHPCPQLHPTIYHAKGLLLYLNSLNITPFVFCDFHGHSRRKNVFLYGCSPYQSWSPDDKPRGGSQKPDEYASKELPKILHQIAPMFSLSNCSFAVEKVKESTARVVVWREIGVARSYTMESSYCGCDQGPYKDCHLTIYQLKEMGRKFIEALTKLDSLKREMSSDMADSDTFLEGTSVDTQQTTEESGGACPAPSDGTITHPEFERENESFVNDDISDFDDAGFLYTDNYCDDFDDESSDESSDESPLTFDLNGFTQGNMTQGV